MVVKVIELVQSYTQNMVATKLNPLFPDSSLKQSKLYYDVINHLRVNFNSILSFNQHEQEILKDRTWGDHLDSENFQTEVKKVISELYVILLQIELTPQLKFCTDSDSVQDSDFRHLFEPSLDSIVLFQPLKHGDTIAEKGVKY